MLYDSSFRRRTLLGGLAGATLLGPAGAHAVTTSLPPGGLILVYDIAHNGDKVGEHVVEVANEGQSIRVHNRRRVDVKVMFISAFAERHESLERWDRAVNLQSVEGHTIRDGKRVDVVGQLQGGAFVASIGGRSHSLSPSISTIDSYWLADAVEHDWAIDVARGIVTQAVKRRGAGAGISLRTDDLTATLVYDGHFLRQANLSHDGHAIVYSRRSMQEL